MNYFKNWEAIKCAQNIILYIDAINEVNSWIKFLAAHQPALCINPMKCVTVIVEYWS